MLKVGLVGIGGMGGVHFNAYRSIQNAEVVAVADVRVDMAKEKTEGTGARVYSSLDELLKNERVDMIDICTPSYLHMQMAERALLSGCHVLTEKPMSISSGDTERVIKLAKESGRAFMTAHVVRFMKPYIYLRSVIESGELGKPVHFDMKRISQIPMWSYEDWMRDVTKSGGTPLDLSIHDIDFIYSVFGEPKQVGGIYHQLDGNNDYIVSNLVYDGFSTTITGAWFNADLPFDASYYAVFENGTVKLAGGKVYKNEVEVDLDATDEDVNAATGINIKGTDGYASEIEYFVSCILSGEAPTRVLPESSQGSVRLVERILQNAVRV